MNFIIAVDLSTKHFIMCDSRGENKVLISVDDTERLKEKIHEFNKNNLAIFKDEILIKNSITVLGKYYTGKYRDVKFLVCDGNMHRKSLTREELLDYYKKVKFTNIRVSSDGKIRMLKGSISFLNNLNTLRQTNTVLKIGAITACTPGSLGVGKKMLGKRLYDGKVGCVKFELFPNSKDIYNEVIAYKLGKLLGFDVAEATIEYYNNKKCVISLYNYDITNEKVSSLKSEVGTERFHIKFNKRWFMETKSINAWNKFIQMIMLDLIMHQTDRHISNIAFKGKDMYSLYDNGRALFFDSFDSDKESIDLNNRGSIVDSFVRNEHGYGWMFLEDVLGYNNYKHLINHNLTYKDFKDIVINVYEINKSSPLDEIYKAHWLAEYMYKVYLIITCQESRWKQ